MDMEYIQTEQTQLTWQKPVVRRLTVTMDTRAGNQQPRKVGSFVDGLSLPTEFEPDAF
jgi:hypothetical protein